MQKKPSNKPIIILIIVLVLGVLAYFYFSGAPTDNASSLIVEETPTSEAQIAGAEILVLLNQLSSLDIDPDIFSTPVYKSLIDHTVTVLEQRVGKPNPFALSFGGPSLPVSTSTQRAR